MKMQLMFIPKAQDKNVTKVAWEQYRVTYWSMVDGPRAQLYSLYPARRHFCPEDVSIVCLPHGCLHCPKCGEVLG